MSSAQPSTLPARAVVIGATGFVGGAVVSALRARGAAVTEVRAPRLSPVGPRDVEGALVGAGAAVADHASRQAGADVVVNAAGRSEAGSSDLDGLLAANALFAGVVAQAARAAGVPRLVHVSSGAVQGDAPVLDSTGRVRPFSAYSYSKAVGEQLVLRHHPGAVVYRPAGVQGSQRAVSRKLVAVARSPLALVAGDGDGNSPQALIENVADAAAFLALTDQVPPAIFHHPSEGVSVGELLELLGGRGPRALPTWFALAVVRGLKAAGRLAPSLAARRRRFEVMWFGQEQAPSWLTEAGWTPVLGPDGWRALGKALQEPV